MKSTIEKILEWFEYASPKLIAGIAAMSFMTVYMAFSIGEEVEGVFTVFDWFAGTLLFGFWLVLGFFAGKEQQRIQDMRERNGRRFNE